MKKRVKLAFDPHRSPEDVKAAVAKLPKSWDAKYNKDMNEATAEFDVPEGLQELIVTGKDTAHIRIA